MVFVMKILMLFSCVLLITSGCTTSPYKRTSTTQLSAGGHLLLETKILSHRELLKIIAMNKEYKDTFNISTEDKSRSAFLEPDFLVGSGLVSASVSYLKTGNYVSPSYFLDKNLLTKWALTSLIKSSGMKYHPTFYDFFFVRNCSDLACVTQKLSAFGTQLMEETLTHPAFAKTQLTRKDIDVKTPGLLHSSIRVELGRYQSYVRLLFADELRKGLWGNKKPREYFDQFYLAITDPIVSNNLLVNVSSDHPDIIVYQGIKLHLIQQGKPCFGGFFVNRSNTIPVDELYCVKKSTQ